MNIETIPIISNPNTIQYIRIDEVNSLNLSLAKSMKYSENSFSWKLVASNPQIM